MKKALLTKFLLLCTYVIYAQAPAIEWQKCLGGTGKDEALSMCLSGDGGYVLAGYTGSSDGDVTGGHSPNSISSDAWIAKTDASGNLVWQKAFGGTSRDVAHCVRPTEDGGLIVTGESRSQNGDMTGIANGGNDAFLLKLKTDGTVEWVRSYYNVIDQRAHSVQQTSDKGYILGGQRNESSNENAWMMKTDAAGDKMWDMAFTTGSGTMHSVLQNSDGDFIGVGEIHLGNTTGLYDVLVVKIDQNGSKVWEKHLGGSSADMGYEIKQTSDGGYILVGETSSNDRDVSDSRGDIDFWVVKLDPDGNISWQRSLGGSGMDHGYGISQINGGYVVTGNVVGSHDKDVSGNHGHDMWVVQLDNTGNIVWQKCLGGSSPEEGRAIFQTPTGGLVIAGMTRSDNNGDVSGFHSTQVIMGSDFWLVKLQGTASGIGESDDNTGINIYPNPASNTIHMDGFNGSYKVSVYNSLAQRMPDMDVTANIMDISTLKKGVYFLHIQEHNKSVVKKIVVSE